MKREISVLPPDPPAERVSGKKEVVRSFHFRFITPLFGCEVGPGEQDKVTPVRVPSIRGQLRFWWRALAGNSSSDFISLKEREDLIWGSTSQRSSVSVAVKNARTVEIRDRHRNPPNYVVFPYRQEKTNPIENLVFDLEISFPGEYEKDVMAAMWGWANFGGLGARTRRGGGSLFCQDFAPSSHEPEEIRKWLADWLNKISYSSCEKVPQWPVFNSSLFVGPVQTNAHSAWEKSITVFQQFRQGEGVGRNKGASGRQGRSRWPEADTIRRLTGKSSPRHKPSPDKPAKAFPRAELGMPIIMWFKDREDPGNTTIFPTVDGREKLERMASPIILKPLAISNNKYIPLCVCLDTPPLKGICFEKGSHRDFFGVSSIENPSFAEYPNSPMAGRSEKGSAVEAFLAFAGENGFREVSI